MKQLTDLLSGTAENRLYPFLCVYGDETREMLQDAVAHIYNSGARALCVESKRPGTQFMKEQWWLTMDTVLSECRRLGMKVWMVDEPYVPSGYAGGAVKNHPHLKKRHLVETHVDVMGPMRGAKIPFCKTNAADTLLGVYAYRRADGESEALREGGVELTVCVDGDLLYWDIPDGVWRVFFLFESTAYADNYLDYFNRDSVALAISEVYEPHYQRYKEYFGETLVGFFSDEPAFRNPVFSQSGGVNAFSDNTVGKPTVALPWGEAVAKRMCRTLSCDRLCDLVALWYDVGEIYSEVRFAYMDAVTSLYDENFGGMLRRWCYEHGVIYTGHVVEDADMHARLGGGVGHYFRAMNAYEMAGVDIVLGQVLPGFAHARHTASCGGGYCRTDFFHYVLGQLAASASHADPAKEGKTLCEIFGAYGWGEDVPMMKWLVDFMLVRGVTAFVPHSFTTHTVDPVFPPTFSAKNGDPQFEGLKKLFSYMNRAGALLSGGVHKASVAVAYTAFAEWADLGAAGQLEKAARQLYDGHLNYDILSEDTILGGVCVEDGKLLCHREAYGALIVPYAPRLPGCLLARLSELSGLGVSVIFVNERPLGADFGEVVPLSELAALLKKRGLEDAVIEGNELLRYYHATKGKRQVYMFFNESLSAVKASVRLREKGPFLRLDVLNGGAVREETADGEVSLCLAPYESEILIFDDFSEEELAAVSERPAEWVSLKAPERFWVETAPVGDPTAFTPLAETEELFDIAAKDRLPDFSGVVRYTASFEAAEDFAVCELELGEVGGVAEVLVNGVSAGLRICSPYRYRTEAVKVGENTLEIRVYTSLAGAARQKGDMNEHTKSLMSRIPLKFCGVQGPIVLRGHGPRA